MSRVLILDDNLLFCRTLRDSLLLTPGLDITDVEFVNTVDKAKSRVINAVESKYPYDILLVDQYLGNNIDGIQGMADLRRISPTTDAIVFTGMGDPTSGQRAYTAGAARYLQKPFEIDELISIMQSLNEWRRMLHERTWMQTLVEVTEAAEKQQEFGDVARVIVEGSLRLGFERSVLFWVPERQPSSHTQMIGMHMAGRNVIPQVNNYVFRMEDSPYARSAQASRDVLIFHRRDLGAGVIEKTFGSERYPPPQGEWACLPLWANERFSGLLLLDNADRVVTLSDDQRKLLQLYSRQVTAILERARLFGRVEHNRRETQRINQIGKQITMYVNELDDLLKEVRIQIGKRFDVHNFFIALVNEETQKLDFRLHYEGGRRRERHYRDVHSGLSGHMVVSQSRKPLYLREGTDAYRAANAIRSFGRPARSWLGVPLWVAKRMIGVMVLQDYEQDQAYSQDDINLLDAVADQIAGAIYVALIVEREQERLNLLQRASAELVRLLNDKEEWMWRALLNIISASYGLKFNRVWLFLAEAENTRLAGRLGVGHVDARQAVRDWKRDQHKNMTFERFIDMMRDGQLRTTPLEEMTRALEFTSSEAEEDVLFQVLETGRRRRVQEEEAARMLPGEFVRQFQPGECAVVPLRAGENVIGLVIVDNKHNREPILEETLDRMETFLNMASLVYLNERRRVQQQALLNATHVVARQNEKVSLGTTLMHLCEAALMVNDADWVTVYPLRDGSGPDSFDVQNIGKAGEPLAQPKPVKGKPRQRGVSAYIMRSGRLVIDDLLAERRLIDGEPLDEHPFIVREGICAFIGVPVLDQLTGVPLGVMYLDYRKPQCFSDEDIQRAETFANLAGIAIRNARSVAQGQASQRELNILQQVLKGSLSNSEEVEVIRTVLNAMHELLQGQRVDLRVTLGRWVTLLENQLPELVLRSYLGGQEPAGVEGDLLPEELEWVRRAIDTELPVWAEDDHRIFVPIKTGIRCLGVLDVRDADEEIANKRRWTIERIAAFAALALDNARRQENLVRALKAVRAFTGPTSLNDTLRSIVEQIRLVTPDLSALTIWYMDDRTKKLRVGPTFGVRFKNQMLPTMDPEGTVVKTVMDSKEPIWAEDVYKVPVLLKEFVFREEIRSVAALPLRADNQVIGTMFFNYRMPHHFSQEERSLFLLLAEIVAASIQDASQLEDSQRESERLELTLNITEAIGSTVDLNQVIEKALTQLAETMSYIQTSVCLLLYNETDYSLEFAPISMQFYPVDVAGEMERRSLHLKDKAIAARVANQSLEERRMKWVNVQNVEDDPDYRCMISSTRSELSVSLVSGEKLLGVIALESPVVNAFEEDEIRLVQGVAQQIGLAIERVQQINRLLFKDTVAAATAWASEVAHDMNREINLIRHQVFGIRQDIPADHPIHPRLKRIDDSVAKLSSIDPLGRQMEKPMHVDSDLCDWVESILQNSGAEIEAIYDLDCAGVEIQTNAIGLHRAVRHLVRNGIQSMGEQGTLTVRTRVTPYDMLEIHFEDTGPGIDPSVMPQLFQQQISTKGGGGGFGLLLVRQIIEQMGGKVWCETPKSGCGAVFCIRLPLRRNTGETQEQGQSV